MKFSVVIPCFNEEKTLFSVVRTVKSQLEQIGEHFEIIVVDNNSTDSSAFLAERAGAKLCKSDSRTVGGVRNDGFDQSIGEIIVFLDADIIVNENWGKILNQITLSGNYHQAIIGSHPLAPEHINSLLKHWYDGISGDVRNTHLGTGHMIMFRSVFEQLKGFNTSLISGEDFDFCSRAREAGIQIITLVELAVYHEGYPNNCSQFVKREIWHGAGDYKSIRTFFNSKVAIAGFVNNFLLLMFALFIFLYPYVALIFAFSIVLLNLSVVFYKFGFVNIATFIATSLISFLYLLGRGLSPFYILQNKLLNHDGNT